MMDHLYLNSYLLIETNNKTEIKQAKSNLVVSYLKDSKMTMKRHSMKILRDIKIIICQKDTVRNQRFNMQNAKFVSTLLVAHFKVSFV